MARRSVPFDSAALLQRDPDSDTARGKGFGAVYAAIQGRRQTRARARTAPRRHAYDEADHGGALKQIEYAQNHISAVQGGNSEFDAERLGGYFKAAMDCMRGGGEAAGEDEEEIEGGGVQGSTGPGNGAAGPGRPLTGKDARKRELGEVESRSTSEIPRRGSNPDHRNDFNSSAQGGADSALSHFDSDELMQRN